jgi:hypothetical protein
VCGRDALAYIRLASSHLDVVRIECPRCDRAGSYRKEGLLARFGADDIALPDLLDTCPRDAISKVIIPTG